MISEQSQRALDFSKRIENCNTKSVFVALEILSKSINASARPIVEVDLHNAIKSCPEKIINELPYSDIKVICLAY